jgi:hypothetical protein
MVCPLSAKQAAKALGDNDIGGLKYNSSKLWSTDFTDGDLFERSKMSSPQFEISCKGVGHMILK